MQLAFASSAVGQRSSAFSGTRLTVRQPAAVRPAAAVAVSARYRGHGTDLSKVDAFKRSEGDTGSAEVQVARLSARVAQLTAHLQQHRKDFSSRRGLMRVLSQRKQLLQYLQRTDRAKYEHCLAELGIRTLKDNA